MEFHTCKNCCLIDQVINNQIQKYDTLSKENVSLHNTLIKSKDTIIEMESEIGNLRDGLIAERQRNLRMYIQQQSSYLQGSQASMNIIVNPEPEELHRNKLSRKHCTGPVPASAKDKIDYISLSKYNELMNLVDKQKRMYEADLDLFQSLSDKCNVKLKQQLAEMREHMSIMLEVYETARNDLFKERKENIECRKLLQDAIKAMNLAFLQQLEDTKKKMITQATNTANSHVREAVSVMKLQLGERDKLVTKLRQQQVKIEAYVEKQEQELRKQQQDHKEAISELHKQLKQSKHKYGMLELRRSLEGQGFRIDVTNIRKEIKQIKDKLYSTENNGKIVPNIQKLEQHVDYTDKKVKSFYSM